MSLETAQTALRAGFFACLSADGTLTGLLGGARFYDAPERGAADPYLVLGPVDSRPLLSGPDEGLVHDLELTVFSKAESRDTAAASAGRAAEALLHGPVALSGHRLVNLTIGSVRSRRLKDGRTFEAVCGMRAVTEPVS